MYKHLMRLVQIFGAANPDIHKVLDYCGDPEKACAAIDKGGDFFTKEIRKKAEFVTEQKMDEVYRHCERNGIKLVSIYDKNYPVLLKEIYNPPVILFYKGSLECLDNRCITAVGAREITPYISKLSARIASDLSKSGITIISGMAHGVDSTVMKACISLGNPVAGVLACGIGYDYPRGSAEMRSMIIKSGGCYLTELLPGVSPDSEYFKARNRILAGLSMGTAIFQAGPESGALVTAEYAVQENRDVFCVPPPDVFDERYSGIVGLLRDGAVPLFNHDDILDFYKNNY